MPTHHISDDDLISIIGNDEKELNPHIFLLWVMLVSPGSCVLTPVNYRQEFRRLVISLTDYMDLYNFGGYTSSATSLKLDNGSTLDYIVAIEDNRRYAGFRFNYFCHASRHELTVQSINDIFYSMSSHTNWLDGSTQFLQYG